MSGNSATQPEVVNSFGKLPESKTAFLTLDGKKYHAMNSKREWIRMKNFTFRGGWLTADQETLLPGALPYPR